MPRKGHIAKREVLPDPIYGSTVITRLINTVMLDGKKGTAQSIVYGALNRVADLTGKDAFEVFNLALENIMPTLEVRSRRIGGQNYQVPCEVRPERRSTLGLRWLVTYARKRSEKTMEERLAKEIVDAGKEFCWRVEATDSVSTPGILQVNAVEYFANKDEDEDGIVGKLIQRPIQENEETDIIKGPMLIKPKVVYKYTVGAGVDGEWKLDDNLPITYTTSALEGGEAQLELKWNEFHSGKFTVSFGEYSKEVTVESLF